MAIHPDLKKLNRAVSRLIDAEISYAWRGAGHPDDIPATEKERRNAKRAYRDALLYAGSVIEAYRMGCPPPDTGA